METCRAGQLKKKKKDKEREKVYIERDKNARIFKSKLMQGYKTGRQ